MFESCPILVERESLDEIPVRLVEGVAVGAVWAVGPWSKWEQNTEFIRQRGRGRRGYKGDEQREITKWWYEDNVKIVWLGVELSIAMHVAATR